MAKELKAHRILREIQELQEELTKHQNKCKHTKAIKEKRSMLSVENPWLSCYCPTCQKRWCENQ